MIAKHLSMKSYNKTKLELEKLKKQVIGLSQLVRSNDLDQSITHIKNSERRLQQWHEYITTNDFNGAAYISKFLQDEMDQSVTYFKKFERIWNAQY